MAQQYISIRILQEAKQAILTAAEPKETLSETIIRISNFYMQERREDIPNPPTNERMADIEAQITALREEIREAIESIPRQIEIGLEQIQQTHHNQNDTTDIDVPMVEHIQESAQEESSGEDVEPAGALDEPIDTVEGVHAPVPPTTKLDKRDITDSERQLLAAIYARCIETEQMHIEQKGGKRGAQAAMIKKIGLKNRYFVKEVLNPGKNVESVDANVFDKTIAYARVVCPEILTEYGWQENTNSL